MPEIRVHLADSDHFSRAGIVGALTAERDIAVEHIAGSMAEALENASQNKPDIVLLETSLSGDSLFKSVRQLVAASPNSKIVVLATRYSRDEVTQAYDAGSSGIISKSSINTELPSALRMVAAGYQLFAPPTDGWEYPVRMEKRTENQTIIRSLSGRDRQLVSLVAAGLTNIQISRAIHISEGSVKLYLARIMDELSVTNRVQLAVIAAETGLITSADLQIA
ncbi:response regulator transcription factor [Glutamicibacter protophormiae]|uniref:response regulator transcription factor n=1 Tax=Glutamicibacter protophormiae TaxID=37930 RepID=UPI001958D56D|nr:response regulator transcription factor [Glutamicibacter protophormiae]QRQ77945.1 response regulator transcription factor [Glutamicibacter protophormiae]WPR63979.1 response regulator transcription factor [Glutamicibacter protophormiae]WPR67474.1 response regulator transcription factor [Glutamicibacter protophormiae]